MRKEVILFLFAFIVLSNFVIAENQEASFVFQHHQRANIEIPVYNTNFSALSSCTANITINRPDGSVLVKNAGMTCTNGYANYTLLPNQNLIYGTHYADVKFCSGADCGFTTFTYDVNPSNNSNMVGFMFLIFLFGAGMLVFGFWKSDPWIVVLGSFIFVFIGLYTLKNGIDVYKNEVTDAISLIFTLAAGYIGVKSALEVVTENL